MYNLQAGSQLTASLGIVTTFVVIAFLGVGAAIFSRITSDLVITPIEDMITKVNEITRNPLEAAHKEEERMLFEEMDDKQRAETLAQQGQL